MTETDYLIYGLWVLLIGAVVLLLWGMIAVPAASPTPAPATSLARVSKATCVPAELQAANPQWSIEECRLICAKEVWIGMTQRQAYASWGMPSDTHRAVTASGVRDQWVYRDFLGSRYLYFDNGVLIGWQE